ncbi:MAG: sialidase family protein, partial [Bacteroidetes bacterium]|nr:sialidase family protein [Bacteroidota bacterium]
MKGFLAALLALILVSGGDPVITPVPMPDQGSAGETHLTRSPDGGLVASWVEQSEGVARLVFARFDGRAWSGPTEIARGPNWFVNWADVPSVAVHPEGGMMAHWLERLGDERYAYGVRFALSKDGGESWSAPAWLHADRSPTEHGFARIVPYGSGFLAAWLDGNGYASERKEMAVHARTVGLDGTLGPETVVDGRTCDCCPTELVALSDGRAVTLFRDRSEAEQRDIALSVFDGRSWSEPRPLHEDGWMIQACPVNGPAADVAEGHMAAAWFTMPAGAPEVWVRFLDEQSIQPLSEPVRVDLGRPAGRAALRMDGPDAALVLWMEGGDPSATGLYMRRVTLGGGMTEAIKVAGTSPGRA